ncbi:MAG: helix-hairpin-helix domain-containing protein [Planctomycetaceae bacterium]
MSELAFTDHRISNAEIAARLDEVAGLLEVQGANPFRVRAYRNAASTARQLDRPIAEMAEEEDALDRLAELPAIGQSLARAIEQLVHSGKLPLLDRLKGALAPERVLTTVFGIGPEMAARIHDELGVETLGELQAAAWDGRLARVPGMGERRIRGIRESLAGRFRQPPIGRREERAPNVDEPPVAEILSIDEEYRHKADADRLPRTSPRRFNPTGAAWLPILHAERDGRHYTAMYSNSARAHEMGTTRDWVVIHRDDDAGEGRWTVVTSRFGPLRGKRIVRGREAECREHYEATVSTSAQ